ncbi:hypothetical protein SKAU_G00014110 [Synaphobranchus kaupii]|uniref:Uncharacterized protein n=1 Tax=Synaphobranchus kaupii TaxID=118154 RepID=A0A9Q1GBJ8_SYNKA|nr:hypothetical protein SKAU_G00014110 [Synaphobranchus kaupii]
MFSPRYNPRQRETGQVSPDPETMGWRHGRTGYCSLQATNGNYQTLRGRYSALEFHLYVGNQKRFHCGQYIELQRC